MKLTEEQKYAIDRAVNNHANWFYLPDSTYKPDQETLDFLKQQGFLDEKYSPTLKAYNFISDKVYRPIDVIVLTGLRLLGDGNSPPQTVYYDDIFKFVNGFYLSPTEKCKCRVGIANAVDIEVPDADLKLHKKITDLEEKQHQEMRKLILENQGYQSTEQEWNTLAWRSLINGLPTTGFLKHLADNCVFERQSDNTIFLTLPKRQEPLLKQANKLQTAFEKAYGKQWKLDIRIES